MRRIHRDLLSYCRQHNVGIEAIEAGDDVKARYFNLQGIEVINPAEGQMVIERKGDKVRKMVF